MLIIHQSFIFFLLVGNAKGKESEENQSEVTAAADDYKDKGEYGTIKDERQSTNGNRHTYPIADLRNHQRNTKLKYESSESTIEEMLGKLTWQAVEHHARGCHLALLTPNANHPVVNHIIRYSGESLQPLVLIDISKLYFDEAHSKMNPLKGVSTTVCRTFLIDLITDVDHMYRFLESNKLHTWADAWVVVMGRNSKANGTLSHPVFRNSLTPVYFGLRSRLHKTIMTKGFRQRIESSSNAIIGREERYISVYSRCLYCDKGYPMVKTLFRWQLGSDLQQPLNPFPDQFTDFHGRKFRTVSMPTFPFNSYPVKSNENAPKIQLDDCLDKRLLATLSSTLNFTYETYAPWTQQFGVRTESGNWTGLVGAIQFNIADFSTIVAPTRERLEVIDTTRVYLSDVLSVVSLKPDLLPQYLVIVKPFAGVVWMYLVVSILIWGITLWLFQRIWASYSGERALTLSRAIFYSWSVILDDPPLKTPKNTTARILLAFWLIATLVATTGYKSALVAYLGVQGKTKPIDSFKDMVEKKSFKWGIEAYYLTGLPLIYFQTTADPIVQEVYKHIEPLENNEIAFEKIMKGNYALITFELRAHTLINSYYTDDYGNTAYHVSKEGYSLVPYFGWGYRKGAPFRDRFGMIQARLSEAGIIDYWTKDVIALRVRTNRKETNTGTLISRIPGERSIKLRVIHLVGVFLLLLLGSVIALIIFLGERLVSTKPKTSHM